MYGSNFEFGGRGGGENSKYITAVRYRGVVGDSEISMP
jgi:hypothetical protein